MSLSSTKGKSIQPPFTHVYQRQETDVDHVHAPYKRQILAAELAVPLLCEKQEDVFGRRIHVSFVYHPRVQSCLPHWPEASGR